MIEQQTSFVIGDSVVNDLVLANHTLVASLAGLHGVSLPAGLSQERLLIGLEVDGPLGSERELLDLARRIEGILTGRVK